MDLLARSDTRCFGYGRDGAARMRALTDSAGCSVLSETSRSATSGGRRRGGPRSARVFGYSASNPPLRYRLSQSRIVSTATATATRVRRVAGGGWRGGCRCVGPSGAGRGGCRGCPSGSGSPSARERRRYAGAGGGSGPLVVLARLLAIRRAETVGVESQGGGECGELRVGQPTQRSQCGVGLEPRAHRAHLGDAPGERFGQQPDDEQSGRDGRDAPGARPSASRPQARPRRGAAHWPRRPGSGRARRTPPPLRPVSSSPGSRAARQSGSRLKGGVALGAVPASDPCPARALARVGAVACQRTSPVGMIRTPLEGCRAPRLGLNVLLAGKPRLVAKLHRPWPGGVRPPARANSSVVPTGGETTAALARRQAVTMGTHPPDRATTSSAPVTQRSLQQGTAPAPTGSRIASSSQEIRLRNRPTHSRGGPTTECEKQQTHAPTK